MEQKKKISMIKPSYSGLDSRIRWFFIFSFRYHETQIIQNQ